LLSTNRNSNSVRGPEESVRFRYPYAAAMQLFAKKWRGLSSFFARGTHEQRTWIHPQGFAGSRHICPRLNSFRRRAFCRRRIVVRGLLRVYSQNLMDTRLLVWVLVLLLSGADPGAALICAASCISSAPAAGTVVHDHETESQPTATHTSQHAHPHGAPCVACPAEAGNSLKQKSDCDSQSEIQALKESAFSLDAPIGAAHVLFKRTPADSLALGSDCQQPFLFGDSLTGRSSGPPLLPLRI
jgi:hypothetical protein